ncbi:MAG: hypothetical protein HZA51_04730 [Planctomycetes bacterium]|nr:hypothetical protein [Planctomycetota bacterium]
MLSRTDVSQAVHLSIPLKPPLGVMLSILVFSSPAFLLAQSAPPTPDDYPIEDVGVIYEGLIVSPSGSVSYTSVPSVSFEVPESGSARFVVSCMANEVTSGTLHNFIVATAFSGYSASVPPNADVGPIIISSHSSIYVNTHLLPSTAMNAEGAARVGWYTSIWGAGLETGSGLFLNRPELTLNDFDIDSSASTWPVSPAPSTDGTQELSPSVGISGDSVSKKTVICPRSTNVCPINGDAKGLVYHLTGGSFTSIRSCTNSGCSSAQCSYRVVQWQPSTAMRDDGYFVQVFADAESSGNEPAFDIRMRIYEPDGDVVSLLAPNLSSLGTEILVNTPGQEQTDSIQKQPSVAFDSQGNIVVVWLGPENDGCASREHVYARVYNFESLSSVLRTRSGSLIVDNDSAWVPSANSIPLTAYANPTVALSKAADGKFVVAWTTSGASPSFDPDEIHGQYFNAEMAPRGSEFRINQDTSQPGSGPLRNRRLGTGAQHTLDYGPDGEVVCVWSVLLNDSSNILPDDSEEQAYFTMLPPGYDDYLFEVASATCCKGDFDSDEDVDGLDIQGFVDIWSGYDQPCLSHVENFCRADINADGVFDYYDVDAFVVLLLADDPPTGCAEAIAAIYDCNGNEVADATDIANETSADCNNNGFPDECDTALWAPFGATDCNENSVPDECDIKAETSADCNVNGIPDECDIASHTSPDWDEDGIPDECAFERSMMSGEGGSGCADTPENIDAAWLEFYEWSIQQCWGPGCTLTGSEQYQAIVDKKCELGLQGLNP